MKNVKIAVNVIATVFGLCMMFIAAHRWYTSIQLITATLDGRPIAGANVYIDGNFAGVTPYKLQNKLDRHSITVTLPYSFNAGQGQITVHPTWFNCSDWVFVFKTPYVVFAITTLLGSEELRGSSVEINGVYVGNTPYTTQRLKPGTYKIKITPPKTVLTVEGGIEVLSQTEGAFNNTIETISYVFTKPN